MASTPWNRIETLRARITDSDEIAPADRELLDEFTYRLELLSETYSDHRHEKLLRHCTIISENMDGAPLSGLLSGREAAERVKLWIDREYDNEETNRDYRSAVRVFGKRIAEADDDIDTNDSGVPRSVAWIPTGTSSRYDPTPDPRDMLRWDTDVKPMIGATFNARDAAMIALQFDAGLRGGEFKSLCVGDIQKHKHGLQVTVEGKQGRRTVVLIPSVPFVSQWLDRHPDRSDSGAPLWSKLHEPEGISDNMVSKVLDEAAERADVSRPVTLTNFRKSSAAFYASRNLNQAHLEDHHGWVRGSKAASRYISVFGEDADREIARVHGVDVSDDEPEPVAPVDCFVCETKNDRAAQFCMQCGQVLDPQTAAEIDESDDDLSETLAELPPEKARMLLDVADTLDDPEIKSVLVDSE